jgi:RNA polymerase sigma-70 factor (ECF subfamily)
MPDLPLTRPSLLVRIKDLGDREAWQQFVDLYGPVVYGFGRQRGLQDADAGELTQEVLRAVAAASGKLDYDPRRGAFRSWLYTIARNKLYDFWLARSRQPQGSGDSDVQARLEEEPARDEALWDDQCEQHLFAWASERVRGEFAASTWQAFWQVAVEGKKPRQAAEDLGLSVAAVYIAKGRVLARLKKEIEEVVGE